MAPCSLVIFPHLLILLALTSAYAAGRPSGLASYKSSTFALEGAADAAGQGCKGVPSSSYVDWQCSQGTPDSGECKGVCRGNTHAPYGSPLATCKDGVYTVLRTCMAGRICGFDDIPDNGSTVPPEFCNGLLWQGLRVIDPHDAPSCPDRTNGFLVGLRSGTKVGYSLEIGEGADKTNYASVATRSPEIKMSVLGFYATAAWEDTLDLHVQAYDADGALTAVRVFQGLAYYKSTFIDLRTTPGDTRFSGIHRLDLLTTGGKGGGCAIGHGKQVVIDDFEAYVYSD